MDSIKKIGQLGLVIGLFYCGQWIAGQIESIIVIPGSIIGMLLLYLLLTTGVLKLEHVEGGSQFFLKNMGFFFIPLGVSLIDSYKDIQGVLWQVILILIVTNILVMGVTSKVTEHLMQRKEGA